MKKVLAILVVLGLTSAAVFAADANKSEKKAEKKAAKKDGNRTK